MIPTLVDLTLPSPGFYNFISSWIFEHKGLLFVVDPGPTNSLPILYEALGDREPDYILLTHIHVDHAGGIGALSSKFPEAKIVAFEKAHRHLIDPSRLIEASNKNVGSLMDLYGPIEAVEESRILTNINEIEGLKVIHTPGHAPHHISFIFKDYIFCGEALGISCPQDSELYLRPASPPVFDLLSYLGSIDKLESVYQGQKFCLGHYGMLELGNEVFDAARSQIVLWKEIVGSHDFKDDDDVSEENYSAIIYLLIRRDKYFEPYENLNKELKEREKIFIKNSIRGLK
jgi:glyoxylase-like metal-dependent hydrolase (beta-lactamase superfamily II)